MLPSQAAGPAGLVLVHAPGRRPEEAEGDHGEAQGHEQNKGEFCAHVDLIVRRPAQSRGAVRPSFAGCGRLIIRGMALEVLSDADCTARLRAGKLGRLALVDHDGKPLIFPVNYFFDEGLVVFRTAPGTKLDLAPGAHVVFEIDDWDEQGGSGWSVVARGIAHDFTQPRSGQVARVHYWPVEPAAPGVRHHWIGILVTEITGRAFPPPAKPGEGQGGG